MAKTKNQSAVQSVWSYIFSASLVLLVIATGFATRQRLFGWEVSVFRPINDMPDIWQLFWLAVTQFGSAWMMAAIIALTWLWRRKALATELFLRGFITYFLVQLTKMIIARPRPALLLPLVHEREIFVSGYGFPSGHTAMATVFGLALWPYLPKKWRWIVPVWIIFVAFSRIYLGVHAPLDVLGGFALGTMVAAMGHIVQAKRTQRA